MSHKANHWLSELPADRIKAGAFRVLFHLCDAHNSRRDPQTACFPSQNHLMQVTNLSNGGLNKILNALEEGGLIRRRRTRKPDGTRGPTYYLLGCDFAFDEAPITESGDGDEWPDLEASQLHYGGDGTNSTLGTSPTPLFDVNQLHPSGDKPVKGTGKRTGNTPHTPKGDLGFGCETVEDEFEKVWTHYPRNAGKGAALKAWIKARRKTSFTEITEPLGIWIRYQKQNSVDISKIPHFATWLNQTRWLDNQSHAINANATSDTQLDRLNGPSSSDDQLDNLFPQPKAIGAS